MRRSPQTGTGTAALYVGLVLSHLLGEGGGVRVLRRPGETATLPCARHHESHSHVSVQWRSPRNQLLCHYIKHKAFQNCTSGYAISDGPGAIALNIQRVRGDDFGTHVCSVSKPHNFSDYSIELERVSESVTSAPPSGGSVLGASWTLLYVWTMCVCM